MTVPCPHGFPKPANCYECMEDGNIGPPPAPKPPTSQGWTLKAAAFAGQCPGCNLAIYDGQLIIRVSNGTWQHERCAP